jgi:probable F420-dependent oxidoreductase
VRFGITFANAGPWAVPEFAAALAEAAERLGFESLWTVEHVVVPEGYGSAYPYSRSGRMPGPEEAPIPDPLVWLSWIGGQTSSIRLATGILILPQRNPVILAKEVATLDVLTGGRAILGVGVGWLKEEFDILGVPFEERAERMDESIEALRALWTQESPAFRGRHFDFTGAKSYPHPSRPGGVPIVVGGHSKAAARRAGRLGDGFFPARGTEDELRELIAEMRAAAAGAGRDPDAVELTLGPAKTADQVRSVAALGASRVVISPPAFEPAGLRGALERYAAEVMDPIGRD